MATRLFGTDGVRGVAGVWPLDPPTVARLGAAVVRAPAEHRRASFSAATRASPASGSSASSRAARRRPARRSPSAGVLPTPGVAYLARALDFDLGVVLSASHNPYGDNGIKVFSGQRREVRRRRASARVEARHGRRVWSVADAPDARGRRRRLRRAVPRAPARACCRRPARSPARASASTWPTARRRRRRCRLFESSGLRRRGAGRRARRPQHQPGVRIDASGAAGRPRRLASSAGWASRSTATATARFSSTIAATSSMATPCC